MLNGNSCNKTSSVYIYSNMHLPEFPKHLSADMVNLAEDNDIVLSYHNYVVRSSDVALLEKDDTWLNDIIIGFYFEYLDQQYKKDNKRQILFIDPGVTQLLKMQAPLQYNIFLDPIEAITYDLIFFPLNDCDGNEPGGSHWSLLIFSRKDEMCYHYDSSNSINRSVAEKFARNIIKYFLNKREKRYLEMDCPQQNNCYDCGLYVLCLAALISKYILKGLKISDCDYSIVTEMVSKKRMELLGLIMDLRNIHDNE